MPDTISIAFTRIAELSIAAGQAPINRIPGAWSYAFTSRDKRRTRWEWQIACNGHREPVESPIEHGGLIEPFTAQVFVNGWPFAILDPVGGGIIGAGEGANEDSFIAAMESEIARLEAVPA